MDVLDEKFLKMAGSIDMNRQMTRKMKSSDSSFQSDTEGEEPGGKIADNKDEAEERKEPSQLSNGQEEESAQIEKEDEPVENTPKSETKPQVEAEMEE